MLIYCVFCFQHAWDELDAWHSSLMLLESQVQDVTEEHPDTAQVLMDRLTEPQQLYQDAAQRAEQRTVFLSKVRLFKAFQQTVPLQRNWTLTRFPVFWSRSLPACRSLKTSFTELPAG